MTADELMGGFAAALGGRDPAAFAALCTDDVHYEDPLTAHPLTGPRELAAHVGRLWTAFPDVRVETTGPCMTGGTHLALPVKVVATHRGELEGVPTTGRFLLAHAVVVAERRDATGPLWRVRAFFDAYGAAVQLGVMPERGSLGEKALLVLRGFGLRSRT